MTIEFVGPFEHHEVVIDGFAVPYLQASPLQDGGVHINLDRRLGVDLSAGEAERILPFIADCIAVAAGYTSRPLAGGDGLRPRKLFSPMTSLWTVEP